MKTKLLLAAAVLGAASLSAQAGVHFGFSFGLPVPFFAVPPPAPVVVCAPPACPGPGYVWSPGYWGYRDHHRVWVAGNWDYCPSRVVYARGFDREHSYYRDHDRDHARDRDHDGYRR